MRLNNNLATKLAVVAAAAALCGTSAIAETRHHDETRGDNRDRGGRVERSQRGGDHSRSERQPAEQQRSFDRQNQRQVEQRQVEQRSSQNWNRERDNTRSQNWNRERDNSRGVTAESYNRGRGGNYFRDQGRAINSYHGNYGNRTPYYYNGRITRYEPWNGGFRVWLGGAPYPFFVPEVFWRSRGLRIGLSIRLGGYYNPLGYYDYYDDPYYYGGGTPVARGDIRGVVESVDYRRGTLVVRDDYSGEFVTAVMRGRDRTFDELRPGDYIELGGDWVRGTFEAYRADLLNNRDYDRRY